MEVIMEGKLQNCNCKGETDYRIVRYCAYLIKQYGCVISGVFFVYREVVCIL